MQAGRQKASDDVTRPYRSRVMYLNAFRQMDDRERRYDVAYAIVLVMLLVVIPIVVGTAATVKGHTFVGLVLALGSMACGFALGLNVRRLIIASFFQVRDVTPWVELIDVDSRLLDELLQKPTLALPAMCDLPGITFAYNWLLRHHAIAKRTRVRMFRLTGSRLASHLSSSTVIEHDILLIPQDELSIPQDREQGFWREFGLLEGRMLKDVADVMRSANAEARNGSYANKGQKLS